MNTETELRNPISGPLKQLSKQEFFALFDPSVHAALESKLRPGVSLVCCQNLMLGSPHSGDRTAVQVGPGCIYTLEQFAKGWLHDLPSRRQYPVSYYTEGAP